MMMSLDPFRELDRMAATLLDRRDTPRIMPIDLYRDADHFVLTAELPGVDPGSVDVDVDGQLLTIRAERTPRSQEGVQWLARERAAGAFQRQLTLGRDIDTEGISAHYENGVLSVMIPVAEKAKPRKIAIATASDRAEVTA
ncbi:Hsp20/alpha crystallin family protein [Microcella frigidaquae]|uniref:HSP20 family protein n=1 Tax=Microcella frigidaquae TaxID=424758 RepID=A0A840X5N8_9MICO|nr:Hsp20/alpha crystallin family protein [Microcella frigidaquae]MBB5617700.1 HSP20 family protein [Microcella frigidaquae]NHN45720.1 Hsp20/alpha crystallin family protein [Microcella frigidaquae]